MDKPQDIGEPMDITHDQQRDIVSDTTHPVRPRQVESKLGLTTVRVRSKRYAFPSVIVKTDDDKEGVCVMLDVGLFCPFCAKSFKSRVSHKRSRIALVSGSNENGGSVDDNDSSKYIARENVETSHTQATDTFSGSKLFCEHTLSKENLPTQARTDFTAKSVCQSTIKSVSTTVYHPHTDQPHKHSTKQTHRLAKPDLSVLEGFTDQIDNVYVAKDNPQSDINSLRTIDQTNTPPLIIDKVKSGDNNTPVNELTFRQEMNSLNTDGCVKSELSANCVHNKESDYIENKEHEGYNKETPYNTVESRDQNAGLMTTINKTNCGLSSTCVENNKGECLRIKGSTKSTGIIATQLDENKSTQFRTNEQNIESWRASRYVSSNKKGDTPKVDLDKPLSYSGHTGPELTTTITKTTTKRVGDNRVFNDCSQSATLCELSLSPKSCLTSSQTKPKTYVQQGQSLLCQNTLDKSHTNLEHRLKLDAETDYAKGMLLSFDIEKQTHTDGKQTVRVCKESILNTPSLTKTSVRLQEHKYHPSANTDKPNDLDSVSQSDAEMSCKNNSEAKKSLRSSDSVKSEIENEIIDLGSEDENLKDIDEKTLRDIERKLIENLAIMDTEEDKPKDKSEDKDKLLSQTEHDTDRENSLTHNASLTIKRIQDSFKDTATEVTDSSTQVLDAQNRQKQGVPSAKDIYEQAMAILQDTSLPTDPFSTEVLSSVPQRNFSETPELVLEQILDELSNDTETYTEADTLPRVFSVRREKRYHRYSEAEEEEMERIKTGKMQVLSRQTMLNRHDNLATKADKTGVTVSEQQNTNNTIEKVVNKDLNIIAAGEKSDPNHQTGEEETNEGLHIVLDNEAFRKDGFTTDITPTPAHQMAIQSQNSVDKEDEDYLRKSNAHTSISSEGEGKSLNDTQATFTSMGDDSVFAASLSRSMHKFVSLIGLRPKEADEIFEDAFETALDGMECINDWTSDYESELVDSIMTNSAARLSQQSLSSIGKGSSTQSGLEAVRSKVRPRSQRTNSIGSSEDSYHLSNTNSSCDRHSQPDLTVVDQITQDTVQLTEALNEKLENTTEIQGSCFFSGKDAIVNDAMNKEVCVKEPNFEGEELFHSPTDVCAPLSPKLYPRNVSLAKTHKLTLLSSQDELDGRTFHEGVENLEEDVEPADEEYGNAVFVTRDDILNPLINKHAKEHYLRTLHEAWKNDTPSGGHFERLSSMDELSESSTQSYSSVDEFVPEIEQFQAPPEIMQKAYEAAVEVAKMFHQHHMVHPCFHQIAEENNAENEGPENNATEREIHQPFVSQDTAVREETKEQFLAHFLSSSHSEHKDKHKQLQTCMKNMCTTCEESSTNKYENVVVKSEEITTEEVTLVFAWPKSKGAKRKQLSNTPFKELNLRRVIRSNDVDVKVIEGPLLTSLRGASVEQANMPPLGPLPPPVSSETSLDGTTGMERAVTLKGQSSGVSEVKIPRSITADIDVRVTTTRFEPHDDKLIAIRNTKDEEKKVNQITTQILNTLSKGQIVTHIEHRPGELSSVTSSNPQRLSIENAKAECQVTQGTEGVKHNPTVFHSTCLQNTHTSVAGTNNDYSVIPESRAIQTVTTHCDPNTHKTTCEKSPSLTAHHISESRNVHDDQIMTAVEKSETTDIGSKSDVTNASVAGIQVINSERPSESATTAKSKHTSQSDIEKQASDKNSQTNPVFTQAQHNPANTLNTNPDSSGLTYLSNEQKQHESTYTQNNDVIETSVHQSDDNIERQIGYEVLAVKPALDVERIVTKTAKSDERDTNTVTQLNLPNSSVNHTEQINKIQQYQSYDENGAKSTKQSYTSQEKQTINVVDDCDATDKQFDNLDKCVSDNNTVEGIEICLENYHALGTSKEDIFSAHVLDTLENEGELNSGGHIYIKMHLSTSVHTPLPNPPHLSSNKAKTLQGLGTEANNVSDLQRTLVNPCSSRTMTTMHSSTPSDFSRSAYTHNAPNHDAFHQDFSICDDIETQMQKINNDLDKMFPPNKMYSSLQDLGVTGRKARSKRLTLSETLLLNAENQVRKATSEDEISNLIANCATMMEMSMRAADTSKLMDSHVFSTSINTPEDTNDQQNKQTQNKRASGASQDGVTTGKPLDTIHEGVVNAKNIRGQYARTAVANTERPTVIGGKTNSNSKPLESPTKQGDNNTTATKPAPPPVKPKPALRPQITKPTEAKNEPTCISSPKNYEKNIGQTWSVNAFKPQVPVRPSSLQIHSKSSSQTVQKLTLLSPTAKDTLLSPTTKDTLISPTVKPQLSPKPAHLKAREISKDGKEKEIDCGREGDLDLVSLIAALESEYPTTPPTEKTSDVSQPQKGWRPKSETLRKLIGPSYCVNRTETVKENNTVIKCSQNDSSVVSQPSSTVNNETYRVQTTTVGQSKECTPKAESIVTDVYGAKMSPGAPIQKPGNNWSEPVLNVGNCEQTVSRYINDNSAQLTTTTSEDSNASYHNSRKFKLNDQLKLTYISASTTQIDNKCENVTQPIWVKTQSEPSIVKQPNTSHPSTVVTQSGTLSTLILSPRSITSSELLYCSESTLQGEGVWQNNDSEENNNVLFVDFDVSAGKSHESDISVSTPQSFHCQNKESLSTLDDFVKINTDLLRSSYKESQGHTERRSHTESTKQYLIQDMSSKQIEDTASNQHNVSCYARNYFSTATKETTDEPKLPGYTRNYIESLCDQVVSESIDIACDVIKCIETEGPPEEITYSVQSLTPDESCATNTFDYGIHDKLSPFDDSGHFESRLDSTIGSDASNQSDADVSSNGSSPLDEETLSFYRRKGMTHSQYSKQMSSDSEAYTTDSEIDVNEYKTFVSDDLIRTDIDGAEVAQFNRTPSLADSSDCGYSQYEITPRTDMTSETETEENYPPQMGTYSTEISSINANTIMLLKEETDKLTANLLTSLKDDHSQLQVVRPTIAKANVPSTFNDRNVPTVLPLPHANTWSDISSNLHARLSLGSPAKSPSSFSPTCTSAFSVRDDDFAKQSCLLLKKQAKGSSGSFDNSEQLKDHNDSLDSRSHMSTSISSDEGVFHIPRNSQTRKTSLNYMRSLQRSSSLDIPYPGGVSDFNNAMVSAKQSPFIRPKAKKFVLSHTTTTTRDPNSSNSTNQSIETGNSANLAVSRGFLSILVRRHSTGSLSTGGNVTQTQITAKPPVVPKRTSVQSKYKETAL